MSIPFDPYYKWLGIPPEEQPAHHYSLLGIRLYEPDSDVIEMAADQRMAHLRSFHAGPHSDLSQKLLNEVAAARICLLKPDRRAKYDELLRQRLERGRPQPAAPAAPAPASRPATTAPPKEEPIALRRPVAPSAPAAPAKPAAATGKSVDPMSLAAPLKSPARKDVADVGVRRIDVAPKLELAPRSAAWDKAVADACAAQSVLPRRRKRFQMRISPTLVQLLVGSAVIGGFLYAGFQGFTMWKNAEYHASLAHRGLPPNVAARIGAAAESTTAEKPSAPAEPAAEQTGRPRENVPSFGEANSASSSFGSRTAQQPRESGPIETAPVISAPAIVRSSVPTPEAHRKSENEVKEALGEELQAKGVNEQIALAHKLAALANDTTDKPTERYVLAKKALDLAVKYCDVRLASDMVGGISTYYEVDPWTLKAETLKQLAQSQYITPLARSTIAAAAYDLVDRALADDRYENALELATLTLNQATGLRDATLHQQARESTERIKQIRNSLKVFEAASDRLRADPNDPDANLTVGKFKCFVKQNWQAALPYLAKANDSDLYRLVEMESRIPTQPGEQVELADGWWDLARQRQEQIDELDLKSMRARAAHWYRLAMPSLSGITLEKARKRTDAP
ncbi:MAG TPA: hypothetical protein VGY55_13920 [Pirellulales bacterium]|jgi:tetratricopeptide (TPR) repeat protein|nr:hypothetical protein [Pirellulales bacterium]